jgi:hypothetical protein
LGGHVPNLANDRFDRIYHVHSRKTAGTSLNMMFLGLSGIEDPLPLYAEVCMPPYNVSHNGWRYSAWTDKSLRHPQFDYGFSHVPLWGLQLPERTFRFTVLRDPASRVRSLYDRILTYQKSGSMHPDHRLQIAWIREGFAGFIRNTPRAELLGQLSMFSQRLDPAEGLERLAAIEMAIPIEQLSAGVSAMGRKFGLSLDLPHVNEARNPYQLTADELSALEEAIAPERAFYEQALKLPISSPEHWHAV